MNNVVVMLEVSGTRMPVAVLDDRRDFREWSRWMCAQAEQYSDSCLFQGESHLVIRSHTGAILNYYPHEVRRNPHETLEVSVPRTVASGHGNAVGGDSHC